MRKITLFFILTYFIFSFESIAQESYSSAKPFDNFSLGLGIGLDHGGFGANFLVYPQQNFGLFIGAGYALAGLGINGGIKVRILSKNPRAVIHPYAVAMYGYNAAVYITNGQQYNKLFYGPTVGLGIDALSNKPAAVGYWSFAILVPFRSPDVQNYINSLQTNYGVSFANNLIPIGISIGYKFVLHRSTYNRGG
jgi:hypothetical protein